MATMSKPMREKMLQVVSAYNMIADRRLKVLPMEARVMQALRDFDVEDFIATFEWARYDEWCVKNNILKTRVGWLCSHSVVAEHCDFVPPSKRQQEQSWA